jgi:hypothetical protein
MRQATKYDLSIIKNSPKSTKIGYQDLPFMVALQSNYNSNQIENIEKNLEQSGDTRIKISKDKSKDTKSALEIRKNESEKTKKKSISTDKQMKRKPSIWTSSITNNNDLCEANERITNFHLMDNYHIRFERQKRPNFFTFNN